MKSNFFFLLLFVVLVSCQNNTLKENVVSSLNDDEGSVHSNGDMTMNFSFPKEVHSKELNGIIYRFNLVSALDFLQQSNENVDRSDIDSLMNESVLILEYSNVKKGKLSVFENDSLKLEKDKAITYLVGEILQDITIKQDGKVFSPNGVNYFGQVGNTGDTRVLLFFKGIDLDDKYTISYYDKLFGSGIIKLSITGKKIIL